MEFLTNEKLTIVGAAGMIGSNMAQTAMMMKLTPNICLYDPFAPALEGVAEELYHCGFEGVNLTYTSDIKEALTGASYIVSSGGAARKAGMTREDLLKGNAEIAAQFGKENFRWRAKDFGFVFKIPKKFVYDRYCVEPVTIQATVRELETFAYQLHILIKSGYKKTPQSLARELVESIRFMPDWLLIPGDTSKAKLDWCLAQVLQRYQQLSTEEVFAKINDWLDATEKRLKRKSKTTPTPALDSASPLSL